MKVIGRLFGLLLVLWLSTMAVAARMAMQRKRETLPVPDPDADEIALRGIFEARDFRSTAPAFRGGSVEYWFGGGTIDLRDAKLAPEGAHLKTTAVFGGGTILVPEDWTVETHVMGVGGAGDARRGDRPRSDGPRLVIDGTVAFGGFGILSEDPREEAPAAISV
jgi:hypothetical protein